MTTIDLVIRLIVLLVMIAIYGPKRSNMYMFVEKKNRLVHYFVYLIQTRLCPYAKHCLEANNSDNFRYINTNKIYLMALIKRGWSALLAMQFILLF